MNFPLFMAVGILTLLLMASIFCFVVTRYCTSTKRQALPLPLEADFYHPIPVPAPAPAPDHIHSLPVVLQMNNCSTGNNQPSTDVLYDDYLSPLPAETTPSLELVIPSVPPSAAPWIKADHTTQPLCTPILLEVPALLTVGQLVYKF